MNSEAIKVYLFLMLFLVPAFLIDVPLVVACGVGLSFSLPVNMYVEKTAFRTAKPRRIK